MAYAAAGGDPTAYGLSRVPLVSSHGSEAVAQLECGVRVRCVANGEVKERDEKDGEKLHGEKDAKDGEDPKDGEKPMEEKENSERLDLEAMFGDDIAVQAQVDVAPAKDAKDAVGPEDVRPSEQLKEAQLREEDNQNPIVEKKEKSERLDLQAIFGDDIAVQVDVAPAKDAVGDEMRLAGPESPEKAKHPEENKENVAGFLAVDG